MADSPASILSSFDLPQTLQDRIVCRSPGGDHLNNNNKKHSSRSFVLYLPTVVLRLRHNPAFSLACRLANHHNVPLLVLCTVLDDAHLTRKPLNQGGICMTARRLTFYMQALQSCCPAWQEHGAGVAIRVHGPNGARTPHHLTLIHQHAAAVVLDEAFVEPFSTYNRNIVKACINAHVPCWSVDGSTTVPPSCVLQLVTNNGSTGETRWTGVPNKAWKWEQKTNPKRKSHVYGAVREGHLDAPRLRITLPSDFFLLSSEAVDEETSTVNLTQSVQSKLPSNWINPETPCPGTRPWTVHELVSLQDDVVQWVNAWPGTDTTVPACTQTQGSLKAAQKRWKHFYHHHLPNYASKRNQIALPHAVSRMSCYWNLGIVSILDIVHDVWQSKSDCSKFLQEVVKWREMSYAHCFALQPQSYHREESAIPMWAVKYLATMRRSSFSASPHTFEQLDSANTHDETWNAMQLYLMETGELHNNARMTWGKTALHWLAPAGGDVLWQMCCLNDRYALDGLSPPSYAGLLWCFGWCDKPANDGSISTKWAHHYRTGHDGFERAKRLLLDGNDSISTTPGTTVALSGGSTGSRKKARLSDAELGSKTLFSYFSPAGSKKQGT